MAQPWSFFCGDESTGCQLVLYQAPNTACAHLYAEQRIEESMADDELCKVVVSCALGADGQRVYRYNTGSPSWNHLLVHQCKMSIMRQGQSLIIVGFALGGLFPLGFASGCLFTTPWPTWPIWLISTIGCFSAVVFLFSRTALSHVTQLAQIHVPQYSGSWFKNLRCSVLK